MTTQGTEYDKIFKVTPTGKITGLMHDLSYELDFEEFPTSFRAVRTDNYGNDTIVKVKRGTKHVVLTLSELRFDDGEEHVLQKEYRSLDMWDSLYEKIETLCKEGDDDEQQFLVATLVEELVQEAKMWR